MPRSVNAQLAIDMYEALRAQHQWHRAAAWQGVARLLLSCDIWRQGWQSFHGVVVYREANDFRASARGPNVVMPGLPPLTGFLAHELGVSRAALCEEIATYWRHRDIAGLQPHNLAGHAFVSLTVTSSKSMATGCHLRRGSQPLRRVPRPAVCHPQPPTKTRHRCPPWQRHRRAHFVPLALPA